MPEIVETKNLDANESAFFARELEFLKARTYDIRYPQFKGILMIPVSTEAGPGAATITYQQFNSIGMAKIIADYADDLPRADVAGEEFSTPVRSIGDSYGYSVQDIRSSQMSGRNLPSRKAFAARRAVDQEIDRIAWSATGGNVDAGLTGLLYNANITSSTVPTRSGRTTWIADAKTADEILADLNDLVGSVVGLTLGVEEPDTVGCPYAEYAHIASTPRSTGTETTILKFFLNNNPYIKAVVPVNNLRNVAPLPSGGAGPGNLLLCYKKDPQNLTLEIPQPFEQFPIQERNLEYVVPCHARCGGVIVYYPLSIAIYEGI